MAINIESNSIQKIAEELRNAAFALQQTDDKAINAVLSDVADFLIKDSVQIIAENKIDIENAKNKGLPATMIDRLTLNDSRIHSMVQSIRDIIEQQSPCGQVLEEWKRPNGLKFQKVSVPIGVLGMIYESRPNVTIDAAALSLKSHNVILLRGGSESFHSSSFLHKIVQKALEKNNLPKFCVSMVGTTDRSAVDDMLNASDIIDVIIPRGGKGLTSKVMQSAKMPVFAHLDGNCHTYVDASADSKMAVNVIKNAKLRRTSICGATESLILDNGVPNALAHDIITMLLSEGVEIVGDEKAMSFSNKIKLATQEDWRTEYLDKKISIKFISGVQEAVKHINHYGSHHTDSILCEDKNAADYFLNNVDSAIVMLNTSTQFADGGEFGFGAEIGIGTGRLHARGPVGLKQLCTFKYKVLGDGQIRP